MRLSEFTNERVELCGEVIGGGVRSAVHPASTVVLMIDGARVELVASDEDARSAFDAVTSFDNVKVYATVEGNRLLGMIPVTSRRTR